MPAQTRFNDLRSRAGDAGSAKWIVPRWWILGEWPRRESRSRKDAMVEPTGHVTTASGSLGRSLEVTGLDKIWLPRCSPQFR